MSKVVTEEVLQKSTSDILTLLSTYIHEVEDFTDEEIQAMFGLTPTQMEYMTGVIADNIISEVKLWSSKKVYDELGITETKCKEYADSLLKSMSGGISIEWCGTTGLPATGEKNKIYIDPVTGNGSSIIDYTLNFWAESENTWIQFGSLNIDLSNIYTKLEVDNLLLSKANDNEVIHTTDIVTDLVSNPVTHNQYPTALSVIEAINSSNTAIILYSDLSQLGLSSHTTVQDIYMAMDVDSHFAMNVSNNMLGNTLPEENGMLIIDKTSCASIIFKVTQEGSLVNNNMYIGQVKGIDGSGLSWSRVSTHKVNNKFNTKIDNTAFTNSTVNNAYYAIKDGTCYFSMNDFKIEESDHTEFLGDVLPKPDTDFHCGHFHVCDRNGNCGIIIYNTTISKWEYVGQKLIGLFTTISYPILGD